VPERIADPAEEPAVLLVHRRALDRAEQDRPLDDVVRVVDNE
jgi:hypothetical protein